MNRQIISVTALALLAATIRANGDPADKIPPLNPGWLAGVRDDAAFGNWANAAPAEMPPEAEGEDSAYWQAVANAMKFPTPVFAAAAELNSHLTFGHLYSEPAKYRGQIVHLEGRLVRLKKLDPPHHAQLRGIAVIYEAWIYLDQPGTHPVCVVMAQMPAGIEIGEGQNRRVSVDGYFFKRYRYISGRLDADGNNLALNTLLLIAPTATLQEKPGGAPGTAPAAGAWWPWLGGFAAGVVILVAGLTWWFRRNDRLVQARLQRIRQQSISGPFTALSAQR